MDRVPRYPNARRNGIKKKKKEKRNLFQLERRRTRRVRFPPERNILQQRPNKLGEKIKVEKKKKNVYTESSLE